MAYYYKINDSENPSCSFKGFHLQKSKKVEVDGPKINYDFSKHVLIELLDDVTPEAKLWEELGLTNNKTVLHKRMMVDSHRIKCRRAIVICINSDEAQILAHRVTQTKIMRRCVCAIVIQDLLSDLCLFEKQIIQYGDRRPQQQLLYVSDLNRCREPSGLVKFLKGKFSQFGTILSVLVCADDDEYAFPEGVIKYAYLSEAFAAELAFDQFVIGKERLSVTTHHNILLSQCDLKARLRNAQWINNHENTFAESLPLSSNYEHSLKACGIFDTFVSSIDNLHIACAVENKANKVCHSVSNGSSLFSCSQTKRVSSKRNLIKNKSNVNVSHSVDTNECCDMLYCSGGTESLTCDDNTPCSITNNIDATENILLPGNLDSVTNKRLTNFHKNVHSNKGVLKILKTMHANNNCDSNIVSNPETFQEYSIKKSSESESNSSSYITCNNDDHVFHSDFHLLSNKTILNPVESTFRNTHEPQARSVHSDCEAFSNASLNHLNDSEATVLNATTSNSCKRKKFMPSQKLCLKSQRTDLSQKEQNINSNAAQKQASLMDKSQPNNVSTINFENVNSLSNDISGSSKVCDWLLKLPYAENNADDQKKRKPPLSTFSKNSFLKNNQCERRSTLHSHKPLKLNYSDNEPDCVSLSSDINSVENKDPNKDILPEENITLPCITDKIIEDSKTPLQTWLKQELKLSVNNRISSLQETSKSVIVCATRTKDVVISVGCSYMTCDFCYPESTNLLLGYC